MIFRAVYTFVGYYLTLLLFGVFGLLLSFLALLAGVLPATAGRERFFQRLIHRNFALFIGWTTLARLYRVHYHGLERLHPEPGGLVLVANHPGLTDITCLLARVPEAICVFKPAIARNPVLGAAARRAGYLVGEGGHDLVRDAAAKVASGHTLIIFPEGTRTPPGVDLLPLKSGFVLIARRGGVPVQLVHIACSRPVLAKGRAVWKMPPLPARADITVGPCFDVPPEADTAAIVEKTAAWLRAPSPMSFPS